MILVIIIIIPPPSAKPDSIPPYNIHTQTKSSNHIKPMPNLLPRTPLPLSLSLSLFWTSYAFSLSLSFVFSVLSLSSLVSCTPFLSLEMDGGFGHLEKVEGQLPPGFRFHPTDEELITYYLRKKVLDGGFTARAIAEVDLNKCEPWELPEKAKMGEKEWYFFSLRDRKYPTGLRTNRATEAGYWKATGKDREIYCSRTCSLVGMKKTLVFYKGRAPKGEKSNWVMHEYRLDGKLSYHYLSRSTKDEWVVSRVFQKSNGGKKGRGSYTEAGSPSLPALLEERESCCSYESESGGGPPTRDHVSCFSTPVSHSNPIHQNQGQSQMHFSEVAAHYLHHSIAPPLLAEPPLFNRGGVAAFPSLRSLQENLHIPFFFGGESSGGNDAGLSSGSGGAMQWGVAEQKVVVAEAGQQHGGELDCMWTYRYD